MRLVVATHGHCFDGLASATLFTRLLLAISPERPVFEYRGCGYGHGQATPGELLTGDQNAILDYRFHPSERLTWYFDHHRTAFATAEHRRAFEERRATGRYFFDADYTSCTKLIADVARDRFDVADSRLDALVRWADTVDSASFASAAEAIDRTNPLLRLVSVVEHYGDDALLSQFVAELLERPLDEVAGSAEVARRYRPIGKKHERFVERVRTRGERRGRIAFVDLTDAVVDTVGKFVSYALFPECMYSVIVALMKNGPKVSVGYNPWCGEPIDRDIGELCSRLGGGGHRVVGAVSFSPSELERARTAARELVVALDG